MNHYFSTTQNGYGGDLIAFAVVREDGRSLHVVLPHHKMQLDPWVQQNSILVLKDCPEAPVWVRSPEVGAVGLRAFLAGDVAPVLVMAHPFDLRHLVPLLYAGEEPVEGPITFMVQPAHPYEHNPSPAAVRHNAWWDAVVLAEHLGAELGG